MNAAMHALAITVAKEFLVALAGNAELAAQGEIPDAREAAQVSCDAAEALINEFEKRGWVAK